jgi:hypothetical protein
MDESLRIRKRKVLARTKARRRYAEGKLGREQICLAVALGAARRPPLVLRRVRLTAHDLGELDQ